MEGRTERRGAGAGGVVVDASGREATGRWKLGWFLGSGVVAVAGGLLLTVIALARQIARQAHEIGEAVQGAQRNTRPLFEIPAVNLTLDRITRALREGT